MACTLALASSSVRSARTAKVGRGVVARAADRPLWNPGSEAPAWLDGTLAGDYGFDPLGLGSDPEVLKYFVQAELVHARFAMLGAAGVVVPAFLTKLGALSVPDWWVAGDVAIKDSGIPLGALISAQMFLMGWAEASRYQDYKQPGAMGDGSFFGLTDGFTSVANGYPGGVFDPMGMSKGNMKEMQTKEIKNGRLAMLSCVGYVAQYQATGKGPIDNLFDHLSNPGMINFATNGVSLPRPADLYSDYYSQF